MEDHPFAAAPRALSYADPAVSRQAAERGRRERWRRVLRRTVAVILLIGVPGALLWARHAFIQSYRPAVARVLETLRAPMQPADSILDVEAHYGKDAAYHYKLRLTPATYGRLLAAARAVRGAQEVTGRRLHSGPDDWPWGIPSNAIVIDD